MTPRADDLVVVIPTFGRGPILARTLEGLTAQTVTGFECLVVVDGGETPAVPAGVRVLRREHAGPGAARNAGVAASQRPLLLFLGDDMVPEPTLVQAHLRRHAEADHPNLAVLGHVRWHPDVPTGGLHGWLEWSGTQFDFAGITGDEAGWGRYYSCNVSLHRSLFEAAGGFDPDFTYYYEDLDLGWRLRDAGMDLRYERDAVACHLHRYDVPSLQRRFAGVALGERMMAAKHPEFQPFFAPRVLAAMSEPRRGPWWVALADRLPARVPGRLLARRRADTFWHQQVGTAFLAAWEGQRDLDELRNYLAAEYREDLLRGHQQAVEAEELSAPDEQTFYRTSQAYLYDLTVFAMSGTKLPYLADLRRTVPPDARILDYGCGIGSDGLRLLEEGYRVEFADFDNPSTRYLRWRLARRGIVAPVHDLDAGVPGGFDAAYCFDVIEHVPDPESLLADLESRSTVVAVNLLEPAPGDVHLHRTLPIADLVDRATSRGLLRYRVYHGRSHLLIYRGNGPALPRWRSGLARAEGEAARRHPQLAPWIGPLVQRTKRR